MPDRVADEARETDRLTPARATPHAVAFQYGTLHGARGNFTDRRRRAFSPRFVGDDARYGTRPGRTLPPFPGHAMQPGQRLREDWFPVVWDGARRRRLRT